MSVKWCIAPGLLNTKIQNITLEERCPSEDTGSEDTSCSNFSWFLLEKKKFELYSGPAQ